MAFTREQIIKAYECCALQACNCTGGCPYRGTSGLWTGEECWRKAREDVHTLLTEENNQFADIGKLYSEIKTEAIKEFAERLKPKLRNNAHVSPFASNLNDVIIDNLVKEMTEGTE